LGHAAVKISAAIFFVDSVVLWPYVMQELVSVNSFYFCQHIFQQDCEVLNYAQAFDRALSGL